MSLKKHSMNVCWVEAVIHMLFLVVVKTESQKGEADRQSSSQCKGDATHSFVQIGANLQKIHVENEKQDAEKEEVNVKSNQTHFNTEKEELGDVGLSVLQSDVKKGLNLGVTSSIKESEVLQEETEKFGPTMTDEQTKKGLADVLKKLRGEPITSAPAPPPPPSVRPGAPPPPPTPPACVDIEGLYESTDSRAPQDTLQQISCSGTSAHGWAFTVAGHRVIKAVAGTIDESKGTITWSDGFVYTKVATPVCEEGAVRTNTGETPKENEPFYPEIRYNGEFYPICGHFFWDANHGATTLCKLLGFETGQKTITRTTYQKDSMPVGACKGREDLTKCTAGGNRWGNLDYNGGWCKKGNAVGVQVACSGGFQHVAASNPDGNKCL